MKKNYITSKPKNTVGNYRGKNRGKNLIKISGGVINQYGVFFSNEEKRDLESKVATATAKRKRMLEQEQQMDVYAGGKKQPFKNKDIAGFESDFVLTKKSKSLQRFRTKEEFENYIENLARVNRRDYIQVRSSQYQDNFVIAMENNGFPPDVVDMIRELSPDEFRRLAQSENYVNFGYIYSEEHRQSIIEAIRSGYSRVKRK